MILYHYSLKEKRPIIKLSKGNVIIPFRGRTIQPDQAVLYSTTELFTDTDEAWQMLALTYYPQYGAVIDSSQAPGFQAINNKGEELDVPPESDKITRVWPSYGRIGGAHEFLITKPSTIPCISISLANGGAPDIWHLDASVNYDINTVRLIAQAVIEALIATDELRPENMENHQVKVMGNGLSVNSFWQKKNVNVALSVAWKNLRAIPNFKFWACIWKDDLKTCTRDVMRPFSDIAVLCRGMLSDPNEAFSKKIIESELQKNGYIYSVLNETTRALLKNVTLVTNEFFDNHCRRVSIPK